jgi:CRISPR-associated protein Cmr6
MPPSLPGLVLPRSLQALISRVKPSIRHPGLQLDKYSCGGEQTAQKEALGQVVAIDGDPALFAELRRRRDGSLQAVGAHPWCRTTSGPLTLHLARASALENAGICLHPVYGFAYLPGTGLKGMARAYAETVWLPAQADRPGNWEVIERVFGWAPGSDTLGQGAVKPWKPGGVPGHGQDEAAAAGAVVFHDAWPSAWPRLVVDIVNNHHATYYQGDEPPGDWDSPVPVYFLAVAPGQEFSFAVGKRRPDVPGEVLDLARQWLDGALTLLGCGAKTVAGYGYFTGSRPVVAARPSCEATLELVSPAFLAGASQQGPQAAQDCDLRPATLRGLLRWWWRTLHAGYLDVRALRNLEAALWGDTAASGVIQITLVPGRCPQAQRFAFKDGFEPRADFKREHGLANRPNNKTTQGIFYAAYGMDEKSKREVRQRHFLEAGATWQVRLTARPTRFYEDRDDAGRPDRRSSGCLITAQRVLEQAEAALWLLTTYGGAGSKARKGFGSLRATGDRLGDMTQAGCQERAASLRQHLGLPLTFDASRAHSLSLEQALVRDDLVTPWSDPWKVLDEIGFAYQAVAQQYRHDPAKAALGLPRKIHGPSEDGPMRGQQDWQRPEFLDFPRRPRDTHPKDARHASPVHIHLGRGDGNRVIVRVIAFPARYLRDLEASREFLGSFLDRFGRRLREQMESQPAGPAPRPGTRPAQRPAEPVARVKVRVVQRRAEGPKVSFVVQEEGRPRGILAYGKPPERLPEEGQEIEVYRNNNDPRSPQYRWDPPSSSAPPGPRGRGGPPPRRR